MSDTLLKRLLRVLIGEISTSVRLHEHGIVGVEHRCGEVAHMAVMMVCHVGRHIRLIVAQVNGLRTHVVRREGSIGIGGTPQGVG